MFSTAQIVMKNNYEQNMKKRNMKQMFKHQKQFLYRAGLGVLFLKKTSWP